MGGLIVIKGAHFTDPYIIGKVDIPADDPIVPGVPDIPDEPVVEDYPVKDGLKGLYDLGGYDALGNEHDPTTNHAPTPHINTAATALNKPENITISEDYCTFTGAENNARMLTYLRMPLSNAITAVVLFSVPDGVRTLVSNKSGGSGITAIGTCLQNDKVIFATNNAAAERTFAPINSTNFAILAMTVSPNGVRVARYTNGVLDELVNFKGTVDAWSTGSTGNAIVVGGSVRTNVNQAAHISLAAIHEGVLDNDQLESICKFVYNYGKNTKGLTIE